MLSLITQTSKLSLTHTHIQTHTPLEVLMLPQQRLWRLSLHLDGQVAPGRPQSDHRPPQMHLPCSVWSPGHLWVCVHVRLSSCVCVCVCVWCVCVCVFVCVVRLPKCTSYYITRVCVTSPQVNFLLFHVCVCYVSSSLLLISRLCVLRLLKFTS